jgi:hypothetical protein
MLANLQRILDLSTQKIVIEIWVWDPRSGIRKKPIPDPGSGSQKGTGSRIRNTVVYNTKNYDTFDTDKKDKTL